MLTCQATGTSLRWDYGNSGPIETYNANEACGMYQQFNAMNNPVLPSGVNVSTVLASATNISINDSVFDCMAILEITSTPPIEPSVISCVTILKNNTEVNATFPYRVLMRGT